MVATQQPSSNARDNLHPAMAINRGNSMIQTNALSHDLNTNVRNTTTTHLGRNNSNRCSNNSSNTGSSSNQIRSTGKAPTMLGLRMALSTLLLA